jgi:hypothetical protein
MEGHKLLKILIYLALDGKGERIGMENNTHKEFIEKKVGGLRMGMT